MQDAPNRWSSDQALMHGGLAESDHRSLRPPSIVSLPLRVEPSVTSNRCPRWAVDTPPCVLLSDRGGRVNGRPPAIDGSADWAWTRSRRNAQLLTVAMAPENPPDTRGLAVAACPESPSKDEENHVNDPPRAWIL